LSELYRALPVALPLLLGCAAGSGAHGGAPSPGDPQAIVVQVSNNLTPREIVAVRVEAVSGARVTLGDVPPGATRKLTFTVGMVVAEYQLVALQADGKTVTSNTFHLFPGALVFWSLRDNLVQVTERDSEE
jgi:hypothetical protein